MDYNCINLRRVFASCKYIVLFLMMLLPMAAFAQTTVTGTVTDGKNGEPIFGATVKVRGGNGSSSGTITDLDGFYTVKAEPGQILEFSYVGYATLTAKVPSGGNLNIKMSEDQQTLTDVVVVGYGMMKRSDLTGAVSSIGEDEIKKGVNTSLEQAMQGRIAGINVTQNTGAPGGGISVQIRGVNTFNGNEPLYVVDGIALSGNNVDGSSSVLATINPSDIVSIEVLKDASATAIYGSRASNGVVLITTKKGENGKPKVTYEGFAGLQQMPTSQKMMNLPQYAKFYNERAQIQGMTQREEFNHPELLTNGTDWQKELFRNAFMQNHNVNLSGGTKDMHYSVGIGYLDQDGVVMGSGFTRASIRSNFDINISRWVQAGSNIYYANTKQNNSYSAGDVIYTAMNQFPDIDARTVDGNYGFPEEDQFNIYYRNPIFEANERDNSENNYTLDYNIFLNIAPIEGLNFRVEYGGNRTFYNTTYFLPHFIYGNKNIQALSKISKNLSKYTTFKQYATYDFDAIKKTLHIQAMVGHESQMGNLETLSGTRTGYISNYLHALDLGDAATASNSGDPGTTWAIESYYTRFNFNIKDRYLITATVRGDGSSSFAPGKKWGYFPSAAFAWRVSNEKFMKRFKKIDNFKFRLGWGLVGNQSAAAYAYGAIMSNYSTNRGTGYIQGRFPNLNLKWESTNAWNAGIDMNLLKNRVEVIVDYYIKDTKDMLMKGIYPTTIVVGDETGISAPWVNTASIKNYGGELTVNTVNIMKRNWQWRTGLTMSFNRTELQKLNSKQSKLLGNIKVGYDDQYSKDYKEVNLTNSEVGGPVGRFYGYKVIGMFKSEKDFYKTDAKGEYVYNKNGERIPVARPAINGKMVDIAPNGIWVGDYIFQDTNNDGMITEDDKTYIGDPNPDFVFGLSNTLTYKNIELGMFFNGSVGNDIYNVLKMVQSNPTSMSNKLSLTANHAVINLIDPQGSSADISNVQVANTPSVARVSDGQNDNNRVSSNYVEDGSYIRLKSLSLGWNLPKNWVRYMGFDWVQVYANVQNLFTLTNYSGYDPEVGAIGQNVTLQGIDNYRYPSQRIYTFGIKVRF